MGNILYCFIMFCVSCNTANQYPKQVVDLHLETLYDSAKYEFYVWHSADKYIGEIEISHMREINLYSCDLHLDTISIRGDTTEFYFHFTIIDSLKEKKVDVRYVEGSYRDNPYKAVAFVKGRPIPKFKSLPFSDMPYSMLFDKQDILHNPENPYFQKLIKADSLLRDFEDAKVLKGKIKGDSMDLNKYIHELNPWLQKEAKKRGLIK